MKILLVAQHHSRSPQAVPLAGAFLAAALTPHELLSSSCLVTLRDLYPDSSLEESLDALLADGADAVGISIYLWNRTPALELARALKQRRPDLLLFAGGPEPTVDPHPFLRDGLFDFAVVGEGEITFVEAMAALLEGRPLVGIPGVATLEGSDVVLVKRDPTALLDLLPSPLLTGMLDLTSATGMLWQLTRGCDFACSYCCDPAGTQGTRRFSQERVEAELRLLATSDITQVFVLDSTFNREPDRAKRILRLIRKHAPQIHFHFELRNEFIDNEQARLFSEITCSLQIGLQSAHPKVLSGVGRRLDRADFSRRVGFLNETGVIFGFDLIYGLPGDSYDGFGKSLEFALSLYPNHLDIFPLAILPGAPLARSARTLGLNHLVDPPYTLLDSPTFPAGEMAQAARLAQGCDIFYSRGKGVAWFNGVCRGLSLSPTALLERFMEWLGGQSSSSVEAELGDDEVWLLQRRFLELLFREQGKKRLLPLALDLVDYHHHYAAALLAVPPELPTEQELARLDLASGRFIPASSTRLARFSYEIVDILESGEVELSQFVRCFKKSGSWAVIYPRDGQVMTESLAEPFYRLLERLDGGTTVGTILGEMVLDQEEALSFLEFALAEGIVLQGKKSSE